MEAGDEGRQGRTHMDLAIGDYLSRLLVLLPQRDVEVAIGLIEDDPRQNRPSRPIAMISYIAALPAPQLDLLASLRSFRPLLSWRRSTG